MKENKRHSSAFLPSLKVKESGEIHDGFEEHFVVLSDGGKND